MMRPLEVGDIAFNEWNHEPPPKLIKRPKQKSKQKAWYCYFRWWLSMQTWEIWMSIDCSMPFQRSEIFNQGDEKC